MQNKSKGQQSLHPTIGDMTIASIAALEARLQAASVSSGSIHPIARSFSYLGGDPGLASAPWAALA